MAEQVHVSPAEVHEVLARSVLTDGMKLVVDLKASRGSRLVDARNGRRYLDMYTFFASAPLGLNPPGIVDDPTFLAELGAIAANKPANPDMYSTAYAEFVATFVRVLGDPALPHLFFVEGGALAVENALKVAFDWKSPAQRGGRPEPPAGHEGPAPDQGVPRPQWLHPVADQHRAQQDRPVPEVRLAPDRRAGHGLPPRGPSGGGRGGRAAGPRAGPAGVCRAPARHRRLHRRADPGRGRRQPHPG